MNKVDHQKELEKIISGDHKRKLLLHSCCAPCSSYCLIYLIPYFDITCFFCNPNITDAGEYQKRLDELCRLIGLINDEFSPAEPVKLIRGAYEPDLFLESAVSQNLASCPEGGERCGMCFRMRLEKTYETAAAGAFDMFATTLTISPHKNAQLINSIGYSIAEQNAGPMWLPADFKKKDGYKQSIELSKKYDLYRQNYCGCIFSEREHE